MSKSEKKEGTASFHCPIPISDYKSVLLAHGSGGKLTNDLIRKMFVPPFRNEQLENLHDGAILPSLNGRQLTISTDSFVVNPIFFPGGDIGSLSVHGTVNDIAMCGAEPLYLSVGLIIEEGFPMDDLWTIILSMEKAAKEAGVQVVTGDTKVVDRGKCDKIFINTTGIGAVWPEMKIGASEIQAGDKIIVSGDIARHGISIMSVREGLEFETVIETDSASLHGLVNAMRKKGEIHALRDPTRGGVSSALNELAEASGYGIQIDEENLPIREQVRGACELLGLDPLYVANEGKLLAFVNSEDADAVLNAMRADPLGKEAAVIGEVVEDHPGLVVLNSRIGGRRVVDMITGEQLPRIC
ncbi:hydrogenase expression/formation protein HypE [Rhodohalobacter sulfatireducens]|uniref:Hydrogenase expression/formation protein HypE n=1 Tax=Rhodohalobacter sulfatireducens TaxID=2911366 RepID=A0ABS9KD95_9BACT|nr:hydrogenase expression/formation protein HypE [Rhodohalobacter sulfatireducens]MCG2588795.1 hydrogenase expression/formation protein HypE [Rhodohalobacter sulfatireducens]